MSTALRREPQRSIVEASLLVPALHAQDLGCTWSLVYGDLKGRGFYAVSTHPDRTVIVESLRQETIAQFIRDNEDLLLDVEFSLGTWLNSETGCIEIDVVRTEPSRSRAVELGRAHGQIAIWDLRTNGEIRL